MGPDYRCVLRSTVECEEGDKPVTDDVRVQVLCIVVHAHLRVYESVLVRMTSATVWKYQKVLNLGG